MLVSMLEPINGLKTEILGFAVQNAVTGELLQRMLLFFIRVRNLGGISKQNATSFKGTICMLIHSDHE